VVARLGAGRAMIAGLAGTVIGSALIPLAPAGAAFLGAAFLIAQQLIGDSSGTVYEVVEDSVTQTIVHDRVLGRVRATVGFFTTITALIGSLLGGVVAAAFGLRVAFVLGVAGAVLAVFAVWLSPAGRLTRIEDAPPIEA
jgi:MFS family permease